MHIYPAGVKNEMNKVLNAIHKSAVFGFVPAIVIIFILMLLNVVSVVTRYIDLPISGVTNLGEFMLVGLVFLSFAYVQYKKQNLHVEILASRFRGKTARTFEMFNIMLSLGICALLVWLTWEHAMTSLAAKERITGAPYYPIYPAKIAIAVGMSLLCLQLIADFVTGLAGKRLARENHTD